MVIQEIGIPSFLILPLLILVIWELVWKGFALWYSARNNHLIWFILILMVNSLGILPIIYLLIHRENCRKNKKSKKK